MVTDPRQSESLSGLPPRATFGGRGLWRAKMAWASGVGAVAIAVGVGYYTHTWIYHDVAPLIEQGIENFLNRPVTLGGLKTVSLTHLEFGETTIATTAQDPNWVKLQGLRIAYNPLQYLWDRRLGLTITAIKPQTYFEQGRSGAWLQTEFDQMGADFPLGLQALQIEDAQGTVVTRHFETKQLNSPVELTLKSARIAPHGSDQALTFALDGQVLPATHPRSRLTIRGKFVGEEKRLTLTVNTRQLPAAPLRELLPLPLDLRGGELTSQLAIAVEDQVLVSLDGKVEVEQGILKLPQLGRPLTQIQGPLIFQGQKIQFDKIQANLGQLRAHSTGHLDWRDGFNLAIATQPLEVTDIFQALNFPRPTIPLRGQLTSQITIQGALDNPNVQLKLRQGGQDPVQIEQLALRTFSTDLHVSETQVNIRNLKAISQSGGSITGSGQVNSRVNQGQTEWQPFQLHLNAQGIDAQPWLPSPLKPKLPTVLPLSGQTIIRGELADPQTWRAQADISLPLSGGKVQSHNLIYHGGEWQGEFQLQQLPVTAIAPTLPDVLKPVLNQGQLTATLQLKGQQGTLNQLTAKGQAEVSLPQGSLTIPQFQLTRGQWQATVKATDLPAQTLIPAAGKPTSGAISGQIVAQGHLDPDQDSWQLEGEGQWRSPQGDVKVTAANLDNQRFEAQLTTTGLEWQQLNIPQPGQVRGRVQLAGTWGEQTPKLTQVQGNLRSTSGWQTLKRPVQVAFNWQGNTLNLDRLDSQGLEVQGQIAVPIGAVKPGFDFAQQIQQVNLQVQAEQLPLRQVVLFNNIKVNPDTVPMAGQLNFQGHITGSATQPHLDGQLAIAGLQLGDYRFSPWLTGAVKKNVQGLTLALQGQEETLNLSLNHQQAPTSIFYERQGVKLTGVRQDNQLSLTAQGLPLTTVQASLPTAIAFVPSLSPKIQSTLNQIQQHSLAGELSGNFQVDLAQKTAIGTRVTINNPRWGNFRGNDLTANFRFHQGRLTVENSRLRYGKSTFLLQGDLNVQGETPQWAGAVSFRDSRIEDILETLHLFDWQDLQRGLQPPSYAKAKDLYSNGQDPQQPLIRVGDGSTSLGEQLTQLSASQAQVAKQRQSSSQPGEGRLAALPELRQLQGHFEGKITAQSNGSDPIAAQFTFKGQDWQWGDHHLDQLTMAGRWQGEAIAIDPLELRSGDQFLRLQGELGPTTQTGQLQIQGVPLAPLGTLLNLPEHLRPEGTIFADFRLNGTRHDPQFQGKVQIQDSRFQKLALQDTGGEFRYEAGRLGFHLQSVVNAQTEPLILEGSVPYVFPFAKQLPASDQFQVGLRLKNNGLRLLNLVTNQQLMWVGGQGNVDLRLLGRLDPQTQTLRQLQGLGNVTLKDAAIASPFLPDTPITDVNGQILADLNTLQVTQLSGKISGGDLAISGTLPLQNPLPITTQPLQLSLNNLAVDVPSLYQGALIGNVDITGTAIAPHIGGQLTLSNGNIFLGAASLPKPTAASPAPNQGPQFKGLTLTLSENIRVQNRPFLDFAAVGNLRLFGSVDHLQPQGQITLKGGQINLFASQLRLDGSQTNTVQFFPEKGLDPYLDLHLTSAASETSRNHSLARNPLSSEIDQPFSATQESLQTVRIKAQINGPASDLKDSIQLSSTPRRSEQEIITLLGGGFINTLGQDSTQTTVGLANLAGSAVLGAVQGQIGEALGLSEFRIFSTPLVNEEERIQGNQIGVAAEAGIDLTQQLGVSIQKVINADRPPQWGLRYRINENTVIRGSSNFRDDSRGVIEFQQRF